jgi:hypothetical protein
MGAVAFAGSAMVQTLGVTFAAVPSGVRFPDGSSMGSPCAAQSLSTSRGRPRL